MTVTQMETAIMTKKKTTPGSQGGISGAGSSSPSPKA